MTDAKHDSPSSSSSSSDAPSLHNSLRLSLEELHDDAHMHLVPPSSADRSLLKSWRNLPSPTSPHDGHAHHSWFGALQHSFSMEPQDVPEGSPSQPKHHTRTINHITLGFIAYFAVAAGPFGIESAVQAAGALPVLIAIFLLPFTWGLPQALMTAELSSMIDENGGYILWVRRGLGEFPGWVNAFNCIASNICDLPTYPVLFCSYIEAFAKSGLGHPFTHLERWMVKGVALLFVFISNAFGMRAVALSSMAMSIFILAPFILEPLAIDTFNLSTWGSVAPSIDWSLFLSTILWNYQGWDSLGCIAGEVKDGGKTYPLAILLAMVLITVNYAFPVATGIMIESDYSQWDDGSLEVVAMKLGKWFGVWVGAGAVVATLGEFNVVMACSSRALWATADYGMLPKWLAYEWPRFGTPIAAVALQTLTTACLMSFSFGDLVIVDTFFNNLTLLLEFFAFLRLKYVEEFTGRPFEVPFGKVGAWAITIPKILVLAGVLLAQSARVWSICTGFNVFVALAYVVWKRFQHHLSPRPPHSLYGSIKMS